MLDQGVASLAIIPLQDPEDNRDIGLLELRSSTKNALNDMNAMRLHELGTAFSSAVKRWVTERADAVERTIRQQCTPIHQSVAWRFEERHRFDILHRQHRSESRYVYRWRGVVSRYKSSNRPV